MDEPATTLYSVIPEEDALGPGLDIYTSSDAFYRVRFGEDAITSMYREGGTWEATVRFPTTETVDGYDRFHALAQELDAAYDTALDMKALPFRDALLEQGVVEREDASLTLRYAPTPTVDLPEFDRRYTARELGGGLVTVGKFTGGVGGVFGGTGALLGGGLSAMAGEPILGGALVMGGVLGGMMGGLFGVGGLGALGEAAVEGTTDEVTPEEAYTRLTEEADDDTVVAPVFDRVNERNRLARILDGEAAYEYDEELMDRYEELREEDDVTVGSVLDVLCREAAHLQGVSATHTATDYDAVRDFVQTVTDTGPGPEPSVYRHPDAFREIFDQLQGEPSLEPDRNRFVDPVFHQDVPAALQQWLEDTAPDAVEAVGRKHSLERA